VILGRWRDSAVLFSVAAFTAGYASVGLSALLIIALLEIRAGSWRWIPTVLDRPLLALIAVALVSALVSPWRNAALAPAFLVPVTALLSVRSVAVYAKTDPKRIAPLVLLWIAGGVVAAVWRMILSWPDAFIFAWTGKPGQNAIGTTLAIAASLALGMVVSGPSRWRWWLAASIPIIFTGLIVTWARAAWLGAAAGVVMLALVGSRPRARVALVVAAAGLISIGWAVSPQWPGLHKALESLVSLEANENRIAIWRVVPKMVADYPLLGTGYGTFKFAYPRYRELGAKGPTPSFAHNFLLNAAAETGLLGVAAVISLWAAGLTAMWRWQRRTLPVSGEHAAATAILAATVTLFTTQLFDDTVMSVQIGFGLFALLTLGAVADRYVAPKNSQS
jgi:O-antigen ligase